MTRILHFTTPHPLSAYEKKQNLSSKALPTSVLLRVVAFLHQPHSAPFNPFSLQFYRDKTDILHCVCLRCAISWFDTCLYCKMITTVRLIITFITIFVCVERTLKIYVFRNDFQLSAFLTRITMLCIRSPELLTFITRSFHLSVNISFPPHPHPWQPPLYSLFLWVCLFYANISEITQYLSSSHLFHLAYHAFQFHSCCRKWQVSFFFINEY